MIRILHVHREGTRFTICAPSSEVTAIRLGLLPLFWPLAHRAVPLSRADEATCPLCRLGLGLSPEATETLP